MHASIQALTPSRGRLVPIALSVALLSACGGDSSSPDPDPAPAGSLAINSDNAAALALFTLQVPRVLAENIHDVFTSALLGIHENGGCANTDGSYEHVGDGDGLDLTFDQCDSPDYTFVSGGLGVNDVDAPGRFVADQLRFTLEDGPRVLIDGTMAVEDSSGAQTFDYTVPDLMIRVEQSDIHQDVRFQGFSVASQAGSGTTSISNDGTLDLDINGVITGRISVVTNSTLVYNQGATSLLCPQAGSLSVFGGEGTEMTLTFLSQDDIQVTVNGTSQSFDCDGFLDWTEEGNPLSGPP